MHASTVDRQTSNDRLELMAYLHGQSYDSYLSTEGRLNQFWSSDGTGVVAYAKLGRCVHVQGGLLCPMEDRQNLLREFLEFVGQKHYVATFYNIGGNDVPLFRRQGFQITKWGEDPLLDLPELTWSGHDYEWVRRQANYCRRQQVIVTECCREDFSDDEWSEMMLEMRTIAGECLSSKPQRSDVRFFNGSVDPEDWGRRRLFVARSENGLGRIEGFLICLPYDDGQQWSIDTYRHSLNAPRGVVPYMIRETAGRLKSEGVQCVSLCLCPAVRYEKLDDDSWIIRRCLQFGFNYASAFFDMPGEYHFKSRFRPRFVRRYICHWPRATAGSMWSTVSLSGALNLDVKKLLRKIWTQFISPKTRRNLAMPKERDPSMAEPLERSMRLTQDHVGV